MKKTDQLKMKRLFYLFLFLNLISIPIRIDAQNKVGVQNPPQTIASENMPHFKISGIVLDEKNEPIIGATVMIRRSSLGTITDIDGKFSLNVTEKSVLSFSFLGYDKEDLVVGNKKNITIKLTPNSQNLDEVVVVGYGQMKRSDITGSVSNVKIDDKVASQVSSLDKLLQGKAAGVDIVSGNGAPGAAINVRIRGTGTLTGNTDPLYVVDGVIMSTASQDVRSAIGDGNYTQENQNGLTGVNPQDIQSIEILKDASATAIYGSRGAAGVVLITTKQGTSEKGKLSVNFNTDYGWLPKKMTMLDSRDFALFLNEYQTMSNPPAKIPYPLNTLDSIRSVDWQDLATNPSLSQNLRLNLSGKSAKTNYYIAGGFSNFKGIVGNTGLKKGDVRLNLTQEINSKSKITANIGLNLQTNDWTQGTERLGSGTSSMIGSMLMKPPLIGYVDATNTDEILTTESPLTWIKQFQDRSEEFRAVGSLNFEYKFSKIFSYKLTLAGDYRNKERKQFWGPGLYLGSFSNGKAGLSTLRYYMYDIENMIFFNKTIAKNHTINGTLGVTYDNNQTTNMAVLAENYFTTSLMANGIGLGEVPYIPYYGIVNSGVFSTLGRLVYNYRNRYVATVTGRYDGSSKFAEGHKFGFFPSFAFAWRASEEKFIKDLNVFSNLKFRAGWGQTGVQTISPYSTVSQFNSVKYPTDLKTLQTGLVPSVLINDHLTWETSEQYNVGVDIGLFNNRLNLNIDAYKKTSINLLQNFQIAPSSGFSTAAMNLGSIRNNGIELTVDALLIKKKKISWSLGGNIAFNRNSLQNLGLQPAVWGNQTLVAYMGSRLSNRIMQTPANIFAEGHPVAMFWGYQSNGIYQYDDKETLIYNGAALIPGDIKYIDQNKDGVLDDKDKTFIGNPNPEFTYGISSSFTFYDFKLDVNLNGVYGRDVCNTNRLFQEYSYTRSTNIRKDSYYNAWRPDNYSNLYPKIGIVPNEVSDRFIEDGSYLRLSNVALTWNVPVKKLTFVSGLSLSISGRNLLLLTKYTGFDPEVNSFTSNGNLVGVDFNSSPNTSSVSFGLSAGF